MSWAFKCILQLWGNLVQVDVLYLLCTARHHQVDIETSQSEYVLICFVILLKISQMHLFNFKYYQPHSIEYPRIHCNYPLTEKEIARENIQSGYLNNINPTVHRKDVPLISLLCLTYFWNIKELAWSHTKVQWHNKLW